MSSTKRGSGMLEYINIGLFGGATNFNNNPSVTRERYINAMLERNIAELAVNRFKWEGLPESVDARFIEVALLTSGRVIWYWDDDFDKLLAVRGYETGYVNFQDQPVSFTTYGPGTQITDATNDINNFYQSKQLSAYIPAVDSDKPDAARKRKAIGMYPNYFRQPEIDVIRIYATRLASTDRTLEINVKNARRTKLLKATADTQLSVINANRQIDEGVEAVQVTGALRDNDFVETLDLGINADVIREVSIQRTRWWNECMGLLGIDNANQDKKERLVAAEVGANDAQTDSMRFVSLNARRQAAEYINDIFGTSIKVEFNVEVEAQANAMAANNGIEQQSNSEESD